MAEAGAIDPDAVEYPTRDGRPVAETDLHYLRLAGAAYGIRKLLASRDDVYVGSNLLVYDEPGNPRRHLSPDIFVAFGVEAGSGAGRRLAGVAALHGCRAFGAGSGPVVLKRPEYPSTADRQASPYEAGRL